MAIFCASVTVGILTGSGRPRISRGHSRVFTHSTHMSHATIHRVLPFFDLCISSGVRQVHAEVRRDSETPLWVCRLPYVADITRATKLEHHKGRRFVGQHYEQCYR